MNYLLTPLLIIIAITTGAVCANEDASWSANTQQFNQEVSELKSYLNIPGLAYVVLKDSEVIAKSAIGSLQEDSTQPFLTSTPLRIASVTKSLTAVIVMQLVSEGKIAVETPLKQILPDVEVPVETTLKHLLTHTSEGNLGETYVYGTNRYALLGRVIESVTKQPLRQVFEERLLIPSGMKVFDSPYLGAHAGLVSTVDEMTSYFKALTQGKLLKSEAQVQLYEPSLSVKGAQLPISLGWFAQTIQGTDVVWSFGQDDPDHSGALWVYVPSKNLTLFILANANTLSDPFRLLMGDVTKSPFAMSFLRTFLFSHPGQPIKLASPLEKGTRNKSVGYRFEAEWVSRALIDIWNNNPEKAVNKFNEANAFGSNNLDPVVHFAALRLPGNVLKDSALSMGERLLLTQPHNRWILLAQCYLLQQRSRDSEAAVCFQRILALPNQQPDFINRLFLVWSWTALAQISMKDDPQTAKHYLMKVIESGITGQSLENAQELLDNLEG